MYLERSWCWSSMRFTEWFLSMRRSIKALTEPFSIENKKTKVICLISQKNLYPLINWYCWKIVNDLVLFRSQTLIFLFYSIFIIIFASKTLRHNEPKYFGKTITLDSRRSPWTMDQCSAQNRVYTSPPTFQSCSCRTRQNRTSPQ